MFKSIITPEMHYDDWARHYDSDVAGWDYHAPDRILDKLTPFLKQHPGTPRLLDVGIGTGLLARKCRAVNKRLCVAGIDISTRMLERCAHHGLAEDLHRLDAARERFPYDDGHFDMTAAAGLMENIGNINPVIREMARVTRPGGLIAFTYMPTTRHPLRETLVKKWRPGRTEDGRFVVGNLELFRHNPDIIAAEARAAGADEIVRESFIGYRTYAVMTVRYNLFVARKVGGLQ